MIKNKAASVFLWLIAAAAAVFIIVTSMQVYVLGSEYALTVTPSESVRFFISVNGIFACVMLVFVFIVFFMKKDRANVIKGFLWAALAALAYYAFPMFNTFSSLIVSYYDASTVILPLMLYIPQLILCVMIAFVLFDFGKGLKATRIVSLVSFFAGAFFMIFHISCIAVGSVAFGSSYDILAQFTNISMNALVVVVSMFVFCITRSREMFEGFVFGAQPEKAEQDNIVSGAD